MTSGVGEVGCDFLSASILQQSAEKDSKDFKDVFFDTGLVANI